MKTSLHSLAAPLGLLAALSGTADAASLSFSPSAQRPAVGGLATADLVVSGLGATGAPSLSGFEIEIVFDEAVLDLRRAGFGTGLGAIVSDDPLDFSADAFGEVTSATGSVTLLETSYLLDTELDAAQSDSFVLATLTFSRETADSSLLSFGTVELTNAFGNVIANPTLSAGYIPIPATATLLLPALGLMGYVRARRKARDLA